MLIIKFFKKMLSRRCKTQINPDNRARISIRNQFLSLLNQTLLKKVKSQEIEQPKSRLDGTGHQKFC